MSTFKSTIAQAAWAGTSFIPAIFFAKFLSVDQYGWFATATAVRLFVLTIFGALLITPLTVLASRKRAQTGEGRALVQYFGNYLNFATLIIISSFAVCQFIFDVELLPTAAYVMSGAVLEFQRRACYINHNIDLDMLGGIVSSVIMILGIYVIGFHSELSLSTGLYLIATINFIWSIFIVVSQRTSGVIVADKDPLKEMWALGKWGFVSNLLGYANARSSTWITLALVGPSGVAVLEFGRALISPAQSFVSAMANVWQPVFARLAGTVQFSDYKQIVSHVTYKQVCIGAVGLLFLMLLAPIAIGLLALPGGDTYEQSLLPAGFVAFAVLCQLGWQHQNFSFTVFGRPMIGTAAKFISVLIGIPSSFLMGSEWGVSGIAAAWALAELTNLIVVAIWFKRLNNWKVNET